MKTGETEPLTLDLPQYSDWHFFEFDFYNIPDKETRIDIVGMVNGIGQVAAIDDIEFHAGLCQESPESRNILYFCTMINEEACALVSDEGPNNKGNAWGIKTMPVESNTQAMVLELFASDEGRATFTTRSVKPREPACVTISYQIAVATDDDNTTLSVVVLHDDDRETVFEDRGYRAGLWHTRRVNVNKPGEWQLEFVVDYPTSVDRKDTVGVQRIEITRGECQPIENCDFSNGKCLWQNVQSLTTPGLTIKADTQFELHHANSWEANDVPQKTAEGQDTSDSNFLLATGTVGSAYLMSPPFSWPENVTTACVSYFQAHSKTAEQFLIHIPSLSTKDGQLSLSLDNGADQPSEWSQTSMTLSRKDGQSDNFYLAFQAQLRQANDFVAIDDFSMKLNETCPEEEIPFDRWHCADNKETILLNKKCDFRYDCSDHSDEDGCPAFKCDVSLAIVCVRDSHRTTSFSSSTPRSAKVGML